MPATFRTVPIAASLAGAAREHLRSPQYGHPAYTEVAKGFGPCRLCLETFRVGEETRLLFTYNPFAGVEPLPDPGPIFVHADGCEPFAEPTGFPATLRALTLVLDGYTAGAFVVARERVTDGAVEAAIARIFANAAVSYIHVRNADAGCFVARVERADAVLATIAG